MIIEIINSKIYYKIDIKIVEIKINKNKDIKINNK